MSRVTRRSSIASLFLAIALIGCRSSLDQRFEFEPVQRRLDGGGTISIIARGKGATIDSSGVLIDRAGSPYWVAVYVGGRSADSTRIRGVRFVSMNSRKVTSPAVPAMESLSDDSTRFVQLTAVELPFEDHQVTLHLERGAGPQPRTDSVQLFLRKRLTQRRVSFGEWLSNL